MEQRPLPEANGSSACQAIPSILCNLKVYYRSIFEHSIAVLPRTQILWHVTLYIGLMYTDVSKERSALTFKALRPSKDQENLY
jgi:hypothetical protein